MPSLAPGAAPSAMEHQPTLQDPDRTSIVEDVRRAGEWAAGAPGRALSSAAKAVEYVTDIPFTRLAIKAGMGDPHVMSDWAAQEGGPNYYQQGLVDSAKQQVAMENGGAEAAAQLPIEGHIDAPLILPDQGDTGVSMRQVANIAAHKTIGRAWHTIQRTAGEPIAQMLEQGRKDVIEPAFDQSTPLPQAGDINWGAQANQPTTNNAQSQSKLGPEARELLSREVLSFLAGPKFRLTEEDPKTLKATNQLEAEYGIDGAAFAQSFAREIGGLPVFLMGTGAGEIVGAKAAGELAAASELGPVAMKAEFAPMVAKTQSAAIESGIAEGATQGFIQTAVKDGEDVFAGAGYGALAGGIFGGIAAMGAKKAVLKSMSQGLGAKSKPGFSMGDNGLEQTPGILLSPGTTKEFFKQLDELIKGVKSVEGLKAKAAALKPRMKASAAKEFEALHQGGARETPEFDVVIEPGDPINSLGSMPAINEGGELVLRNVEVISQIPTKGKVGAMGQGKLRVKMRVKDSRPIKTYEQLADLMGQYGRRTMLETMSPEAKVRVMELLRKSKEGRGDLDLGGTAEYMSPEQSAEWMKSETFKKEVKQELTKKFLARPKSELKGPATNAERKLSNSEIERRLNKPNPDPVVLGVNAEGGMTATMVKPSPPKEPASWNMQAGDQVAVDGQMLAKITSVNEDGTVTIMTSDGQSLMVPQVVVTHVPRRFLKPPDLYKTDATAPGKLIDDRTAALMKGSEQGVTVPTLMQLAGRNDPAWAAEAIQDFVSKGILKETEPGLFVPTRPPKAKTNTGEQAGYAVYIGTGGPRGNGAIGILRGHDPRTKGNWLVEMPDFKEGTVPDHVAGDKYAKTKMVSVPEAQVRTMKPVGLADKSKVNPQIDLMGWDKPMPPQFYQASKATVGDLEQLAKMYNKLDMQPGWLQRTGSAIQSAVASAMHTAPMALRQSKAQTLWSAGAMMKSEGLSRAQLLEREVKLGTQASRDMVKVIEATRSKNPDGTSGLNEKALEEWAAKYPEISQAAIADYQRMAKEDGELTKVLVDHGIANIDDLEALRAAGELPEWLTRNYAMFDMARKDWAKYAKKNLTNEWHDAIRWLANERHIEFTEAAAEMDKIMMMDDPIEGFEGSGIEAGGNKKLISRSNVPEPIRRVMGEHQDAAVRFGYSLAYKRQIVKSLEAWNDIAQHPMLWSPGWRPDMSLKVPPNAKYGNAAGGFVPDNPATRQLLGGANANLAQSSAFLRAIGWMGQKWKGAHTVYNQVSWVNNAVRNFKGVLISGGLQEPGDFQGFQDAARMLVDYHNDPTIFGPNKLMVEAMDFDALGPGQSGSELRTEHRAFHDKVLRQLAKNVGNTPTPWLDAMTNAREAALSVPEKFHNGYDFTDRWAKLGSYLNIRRRLIASGMSVDDAAATASLRVNQSFPNFPRVPEATKGIAKTWGLAAPFLSSKMEDIRVNATLANRIMGAMGGQGETDLLFRLAGASAIIGGAMTLANHTRRANGITDEQDNIERENLTLRSKEQHPTLLGSLDYDEHKRRVFYDLTPYEDALMAFRGNVQDPILGRILFNNLQDIVGQNSGMGDMLEGGAAQLGLIHPASPPPMPRVDQQGIMNFVAKYGSEFAPQGILNVLRNIDRTSPTGRLINPEAFTPDQALVNSLTGRVNAIAGPQSADQTLMETAKNVRKNALNTKSAAMDAVLNNVSRDRMDYMLNSNVRELDKSVNIPRPLKRTK